MRQSNSEDEVYDEGGSSPKDTFITPNFQQH